MAQILNRQALSLRFPPLAIFCAQESPAEARELKPLCFMLLVVQAAKGKTVALTQGTCGCPGAGEGFGIEGGTSKIMLDVLDGCHYHLLDKYR